MTLIISVTLEPELMSSISLFLQCVKFHQNCTYLATASTDRTCRLWDLQSGNCVRLFTGHKVLVLQRIQPTRSRSHEGTSPSRRQVPSCKLPIWLRGPICNKSPRVHSRDLYPDRATSPCNPSPRVNSYRGLVVGTSSRGQVPSYS